jgi:hypothetical protein
VTIQPAAEQSLAGDQELTHGPDDSGAALADGDGHVVPSEAGLAEKLLGARALEGLYWHGGFGEVEIGSIGDVDAELEGVSGGAAPAAFAALGGSGSLNDRTER